MTDRLDTTTLRKKIEELDTQAETLMKQRDALTIQAKTWATKREALHQQANTLRRKRKQLKTRRDQVNAIVKNLKIQRSEVVSQIDEKQRNHAMTQEQIWVLLRRTNMDALSVKRRLNELEWEIQTRSFSPIEEHTYMERMKHLEEQSIIHKEVEALRSTADDVAQIDLLSNQSREMRAQIIELAAQSQQHHSEMLETITKLEYVQKKTDTAHTKYLECRKAANEIQREYRETVDQIKGFEAKINLDAQARHRQQFNEKVANLSVTAFQKLKAKKKVTFDEFKLLREKGLI
jgi:uncharacterized coiled-coil DUF342 family protein